jgi:hypothetical protein
LVGFKLPFFVEIAEKDRQVRLSLTSRIHKVDKVSLVISLPMTAALYKKSGLSCTAYRITRFLLQFCTASSASTFRPVLLMLPPIDDGDGASGFACETVPAGAASSSTSTVSLLLALLLKIARKEKMGGTFLADRRLFFSSLAIQACVKSKNFVPHVRFALGHEALSKSHRDILQPTARTRSWESDEDRLDEPILYSS